MDAVGKCYTRQCQESLISIQLQMILGQLPEKVFQSTMLEITSFRGTSYEKAHRQGSGTATYYRTLINDRENQHPMKYGQLVEKVP